MASAEDHVVNILVAMSSDQENDAPNSRSNSNSNNRSGNTTSNSQSSGGSKSVNPCGVPSNFETSNKKMAVHRRILSTMTRLPTSTKSSSSNNHKNNNTTTSTNNDTTSKDTTTTGSNPTEWGLAWERGYQSLKKYQEKHGHCNVPYRYEEDKSLGTWSARQRKEKDQLSPIQIRMLEDLGFTWESAQDRVWMEKFERLKVYYAKKGNSCVPTSYAEDPELGYVFLFLYRFFIRRDFLLPPSMCHAIRIKAHFHLLFCEISKHFISEWTAKQRQKYTQGRLSSERFHLLNTVGFVYRINKFIKRKSTAREDKKWWEQLERLIHFLLEHGHVSKPKTKTRKNTQHSHIPYIDRANTLPSFSLTY